MRLLLALGIVALLAGCASQRNYERILEGWLGTEEADLIAAWGPPTGEAELSRGGRVLHYGHVPDTVGRIGPLWLGPGMSVERDSRSSKLHVARADGTGGTGYFCDTRFTVDPDGRVSVWQVSGNGCIAR